MAFTPGACPPVSNDQTVFDVRNASSCADMLRQLFQAYVAVVSGQRRIIVRFADRWSEYQKSKSDELIGVYMTIYNQCPAASRAGLPDLNPNKKVRRGAPARSISVWPRL